MDAGGSSSSDVSTHVRLASCKADIEACYPVMKQLRLDQLTDADTFISTVQRLQQQQGYQLASMVLQDTGAVIAVAGYSVGECLAHGKDMYVHDLVTDSGHRSQGYGQKLLHWLQKQAVAQQCGELWLISGVQRLGAHHFYEANGMSKVGYVFMQDL